MTDRGELCVLQTAGKKYTDPIDGVYRWGTFR